MERSDSVKDSVNVDDANQLNRNRSFKSKQLVRSQAIRESQSPPRTISPAVDLKDIHHQNTNNEAVTKIDNNATNVGEVAKNVGEFAKHVGEAAKNVGDVAKNVGDVAKNVGDVAKNVGDIAKNDGDVRTATVDNSSHCSNVIFSDNKNNSGCNEEKKKQMVEIQITGLDDVCVQQRSRRRLNRHTSHSGPRLVCVCTPAHQQRRGRRRAQCPAKQDSGIACSDECPDCMENGTPNFDGLRKSSSLDADDTSYYYRKQKSLSRTDSDDRQEMSVPELVSFLKETLNKNARDRSLLLRIEKDLLDLVCDKSRCNLRFPQLSSYQRMLVHRTANLFQLRHHLDHATRSCVCVTKNGTMGGCVPCSSFSEWCTFTFPGAPIDHSNSMELRAKSILKRDAQSLEEVCVGSMNLARSKTLQQRERDYERVRRRIFSSDNCQQDESQWPWLSGQVKLLTPDAGRNKLLKVQSLETNAGAAPSASSRGAVSKSHSFGGYGADSPATRVLSRQGDLASSSWRLSPSSSGYKTLSLRSTDSVTPSPTGGASPEPAGGALVWAVTDLAAVPQGALVIHPQTGRPLTNPDGTPYHFDPDNPPVLCDATFYNEKSDQSDKKRGRLEKQQSFIDNEAECQTNDDSSKCCCECQKHDNNQEKDKIPVQPEIKTSKPTSPHKSPKKESTITQRPINNHHNQAPPNYHQPTNQMSENSKAFEPTNHKPPYQRHFENRYEQRTFDSVQNSKVYEANNLKARVSEGQEAQYAMQQNYMQEYSNGVTSPQAPYVVADISQQAAHKLTPVPVPIHDPNIRPVSLTNVMYAAPMQQVYPYVNHVRVDGQIQPLYQPMIQSIEENKQLAPSPHNNENTFRIDPSYPYPAVDYSQCGACANVCVDPNLQHQHARYNVPYQPIEMAGLPAACAAYNLAIPPPMQHYPYQDPMQWQSAQRIMPMYPTIIPPYRIYPQVIQQPYPLCQPVFPIEKPQDTPAQRNKSLCPTERNTPAATPPTDKVPYEEPKPVTRQNSNEIALKIQQIKEQMASLNTKERASERSDVRGRRNSGGGILGSYPAASGDGRLINDETQLSSAARAIVNSIRNMQARSHTYTTDQRPPDFRPDHRQDREFRRRPDRDDKDGARESERDSRYARPPVQYRPPYLLRQMSPGAWCSRPPGPAHPVLNQPRRPHPDSRSWRR